MKKPEEKAKLDPVPSSLAQIYDAPETKTKPDGTTEVVYHTGFSKAPPGTKVIRSGISH